jgi:hypothetical protein
MEITLRPYRIYQNNVRQIEDFEQLTKLSYGITQLLLFQHPLDTRSEPLPLERRANHTSYSPADVNISDLDVTEVCRWVELSEYAALSGKTEDEIRIQADAGQLGPIERHPESGTMLLIWPEALHNLPQNELPEIGNKRYEVTAEVTVSTPVEWKVANEADFEAIQQWFLHLVHARGEPAKVSARAEEMLYRSCLNLHWTAFEVFIRSTVHDLFRRHPEAIASGRRAKSSTITYEEVLNLSHCFSDVEALRFALVERAIEHEESEGQSVHGLINLLKSRFRFEEDPYSAWYVFDGKKQATTHTELMMVKDTRNALLHDAGEPGPELFIKYPNLPAMMDGLPLQRTSTDGAH